MSNLFVPLTPSEYLAGLYVATYDRAPDASGLNWWLTTGAPGLNAAQIATSPGVIAGFTTANTYYQSTYAGLNNTQFVQAIYQNVLGANGDAGGEAYWIGTLTPGGSVFYADRGAMVAAFVYAALTWDGAQGSLTTQEWHSAINRQQQLENKIQVSLDYVALLGATTNVGSYGDQAYKASVAILGSVTADPATVIAALNFIEAAKLQGSTGAILQYIISNAPAPVPVTLLDLTIGTDTIVTTGTYGDVTVTGNFGNNYYGAGIPNTYTGGDSITGNATTTLQLIDNGIGSTQNVNLINATIHGVGEVLIRSGEAIQIDTSNTSTPFGLIPNFTGLNTLEVHSSSGAPDGNYNHVDTITAAVTTDIKVYDVVQQDWQPLEGGNGLTVNGGKTVYVQEDNGKHAGEAQITVKGFNGTTDVNVDQLGFYRNNVQAATLGKGQKSQDVKIVDYASYYRGPVPTVNALAVNGTITNVSLSGLFWAEAVVASDVLQVLTINDSSAGTVKLYNYLDNPNANTVLTLNLNNDQSVNYNGGIRNLAIVDERSVYTVLNVHTGINAASTLTNQLAPLYPNVALPSTIDLDNFNALLQLNVSGQAVLTVDPTLIKLQTITVTDSVPAILGALPGHAGFIDLALYGSTLLTTVDASASSGVVGVLGLNAANTSFAGGSGNTLVGITSEGPTVNSINTTKAITAGTGLNTNLGAYVTSAPSGDGPFGTLPLLGFDTKIAVLEGHTSYFSANTTAKVTGFTTLGTDGYSSGNFVVNGLSAILNPTATASVNPNTGLSGITSVNVLSSAGGSSLTFSSAFDTTTLQFSGQDFARDAQQWTGTGVQTATYNFFRADNGATDNNTLYVTLGVSTAQSNAWAGALEATTGFGINTLALGNSQGVAIDGLYKGTPIQGTVVVEFNSVGADGTWGFNSINNLWDQQLANLTLIGNYGLKIDAAHQPYVNNGSTLTLTDNSTSAQVAAAGAINYADVDNTGLVFHDGIDAHRLNTLNLYGTDITSDKGANSITVGTLFLGSHLNESSTLTINDHAAGSVEIGSIDDHQDDLFTLNIYNNFATSGDVLHLGGITGGHHNHGVTIGADNLNTINLKGAVAVGHVDVDPLHTYVYGFQVDPANPGILFSNDNQGFAVNAATDNADVAIGTWGAGAGYTDWFTLGNGNNFILDQSGADTATSGGYTDAGSTGVVNISVGTGANLIVLGNDVATSGEVSNGYSIANGGYSLYNVAIGGVGPTANDTIDVSTISSTSFLNESKYFPSTVITGAHHGTLIGDTAQFDNNSVGNLITGVFNTLTNTHLFADVATTLHDLYVAATNDGFGGTGNDNGHVEWAVANTNAGVVTLIVENLNGNIATVELTGAHSLSLATIHGVNYAQVSA